MIMYLHGVCRIVNVHRWSAYWHLLYITVAVVFLIAKYGDKVAYFIVNIPQCHAIL